MQLIRMYASIDTLKKERDMLFTKNEEYLKEIIRMAEELLDEVADEESQQGIADAYDELECVIEDYETEGFNVGDKFGAEKYDPS